MPRLRVTLVAPFARQPKATSSARTIPLARALASRGHTVTVIIPPYDNPAEGGRDEITDGVRIQSMRVPGGRRRVSEASPLQALAQLILALQTARAAIASLPDVVHLFKPKAVTGLTHLALRGRQSVLQSGAMGRGWVGYPARPPAIVVDTDDWEGDGGWNDYEAYPWWQRQIVNVQERWGIANADAVTVASRTLQAQAWSFGQPTHSVEYLPNGLADRDYPNWWPSDAHSDQVAQGGPEYVPERSVLQSGAMGRGGASKPGSESIRARLGIGPGPIVLLYTRFFEFSPSRALETLITIRKDVPDAMLLVVGAGKFNQERDLATEARSRGLTGAVHLAGWQRPDALPELLSLADVAIALADDNLANRAKCSVKLLQLLRLGIPVIADATGEQSNYIVPSVSGILVAPGNTDAMAKAVIRCLTEPDLRQSLGEQARNRARDHFGWDTLAPAAERAYLAALARRDR